MTIATSKWMKGLYRQHGTEMLIQIALEMQMILHYPAKNQMVMYSTKTTVMILEQQYSLELGKSAIVRSNKFDLLNIQKIWMTIVMEGLMKMSSLHGTKMQTVMDLEIPK